MYDTFSGADLGGTTSPCPSSIQNQIVHILYVRKYTREVHEKNVPYLFQIRNAREIVWSPFLV